MGNKSSRPKRDKGSAPTFTRTDTQGSTRSGLSTRSARSRRSSALGTVAPSIRSFHSRSGSAANTPFAVEEKGQDEFPFTSVPRSLQVHEPKVPILISRNNEGKPGASMAVPSDSAHGGAENNDAAQASRRQSTDNTSTHAETRSGFNLAHSQSRETMNPSLGSLGSLPIASAPPMDESGSQQTLRPVARDEIRPSTATLPTFPGTDNEKSLLGENLAAQVQASGSTTGTGMASSEVASSRASATSIPRLTNKDSSSDPLVVSPSNLSFQKELPFGTSPQTPGHIPHVIGGPQGVINIDETIQLLLDAGYSGKTTRRFCLKGSEVAAICSAARAIFLEQPALLELQPPVKIVGDTHGQFGDLLRLFNMCGFPPEANYLLLGDYVDRGKQSLETIVLLLCYKIKYPGNFFILRGNHECAGITRIYGFYDECKRRASVKTWKTFVDTFNTLPIAAVVAGKIFCVHGGLSPSLGSINDIRGIERPTDVPDYGLLNDLLWSDPTDGPNEWEDNERGVSYCYNKVAINKFIQRFGYDLVCRAHMVVEDGYEFFNERSLVTVFSAPNYCGEFDNWGAIMSVSEDLLCSFELLKPLDSVALKEEMKRGKHERRQSLAHA